MGAVEENKGGRKMIKKLVMVDGKAMSCSVEGCTEPAVRKIRVQTGGTILVRRDDLAGKIVQTEEITYSEHWYCKNHALIIESGH